MPFAIAPYRSRYGWSARTFLVAGLILCVSAIFLFVDRTAPAIELWDESRNIVNALEMHGRGFDLVTTYAGLPDLWNTKPPLLIWLMAGSVDLFGPVEWALRLPSGVAGLGTLLIIFWFVRRMTGSLADATLSVALLVLSPAYFGEHSARTADYDAVLLFFVTAYLSLAFLALHRRRPSARLMALIGVAICCAFLTKSVAALVPGAGILAYLTLARRWRRLGMTPAYLFLAIGVAAVLGVFFLLREAQSPGYFRASWFNDVGGRFGSSLVTTKPRWFYLQQLSAGYFSAAPLLLLSPIALAVARGRIRMLLLFSLCIVGTTLVVFTGAASKLNHYILPAMPFMAIAAAMTCHVAIERARGMLRSGTRHAAPAAAGLLIVALVPILTGAAGAVARRYYVPAVGEGAQAGHYGVLFDKIVPHADRPVLVIDPGFLLDGMPNYTPVLLAYREIWAARGMAIGHSPEWPAVDRPVLLASCDPATVDGLKLKGRSLVLVDGCAAVEMR